MEKSIFIHLKDWFGRIVGRLSVFTNGKLENEEQEYLHKRMLSEEHSADLKWGSSTYNGSIVKADIVAMDSELALKKQDSLSTASGDIPKQGMMFKLTEKQLSDIDTMIAKGFEMVNIVKKVFEQVKKSILGIHENNEYMFLQALSTGQTLLEDKDNVGLGIRVDFGFQDKRKHNASKPWSDPTAKVVDDINRVLKAAKSEGISYKVIMLDDTTLGYLRENEQVKNHFAFVKGIVAEGGVVPTLSEEQLMNFISLNFKLKVIIVDRTVISEKNGIRTILTPWESGIITFLQSEKVGRLVYGTLAEETRKNPSISYQKAGAYIMVKKWSENKPFSEWTSSEALCLPVIDNGAFISLLDTKIANVEDTQTEGDANFAYDGKNYTKASVVAAIKIVNPTSTVTVATKDSALATIINKFNEEQIAVFEANITLAT
ncbi:major capsid protein [Flavobacterium sp. I3-2]|uniref:major capsid protein n=1 Tax=Flavobacterium sp. I3-2 TaxID=2748319 RepID=UPI0015B0FB94|nr:major capsid protein [Flavobacterium sp. I3-2]